MWLYYIKIASLLSNLLSDHRREMTVKWLLTRAPRHPPPRRRKPNTAITNQRARKCMLHTVYHYVCCETKLSTAHVVHCILIHNCVCMLHALPNPLLICIHIIMCFDYRTPEQEEAKSSLSQHLQDLIEQQQGEPLPYVMYRRLSLISARG